LHHEIELKLTLKPEDARRLGRLDLVRSRVQGRARTRRLVSTYFDTPDRRLRAAGIAVRIRRVGRSRLLCVKAKQTSRGGALVRREWEGRVASDLPITSDIADPELRLAVERAAPAGLEPLFTSAMSRTSRELQLDGARVAMDVDTGSVVAGLPGGEGPEEPVCELELEMLEGDPAALFDFARELSGVVDVRLSTDTKAARGFRVVDGLLPAPVKATRLSLHAADTVEGALSSVVDTCLGQVVANQHPVLVNEDPEGVHQMRVGLRRLRSALTLFKTVIPDAQRERIVAEVRWLTAELGRSRDADVQAAEIVGPVAARMEDDEAFQHLLQLLRQEKEDGRAAARAAVASRRVSDLILDVSAWMARRRWREQPLSEASAQLFQPVTDLACRLLSQRHKKVVKRARRFSELPTPERHELRKDVKKLRYACEFFRSLYPRKRLAAYTKRLAGLQDALGYLNDVAVAEEFVSHLVAVAERNGGHDLQYAAGVVLGWHEHALAMEEPVIEQQIERFLGARRFWG
jgi:inorganic triphosphatase YgiF